eukprot:gene1166-688_t
MCICEERHYLLTDQPSRGKAFVFLHVTWWFGNPLSLFLSLFLFRPSACLLDATHSRTLHLSLYIYIYIYLSFEARIELHQPSKTVGSITLQSLSPVGRRNGSQAIALSLAAQRSLAPFQPPLATLSYYFIFIFCYFVFFLSLFVFDCFIILQRIVAYLALPLLLLLLLLLLLFFFLYLFLPFSLPPYLLNRLRLPLMDPLLLPLRSPGGGALATVVHSESTSSGNDETQTQTPTPISGIGIPSRTQPSAVIPRDLRAAGGGHRNFRVMGSAARTAAAHRAAEAAPAAHHVGRPSSPSRGFMNFVPATDYVLAEENIQSTTFQDYFCFNDTATPIAGLDLCSARQPPPRPSISAIDAQTSNDNEDATISCLSQEETARRSIPVNGLCSFYGRDGFHLYLHRVINAAGASRRSLHSRRTYRCAVGRTSCTRRNRVVAGMGIGSGQDSEYSAIQNSDALIAFLNESSSFFRYVYGGVFDTVEDARQHVQDGTEPAWAILTVGDFSKGFTVDIALAQTSLPRTPVALYPDFTGAFQHNTANLYLLSGFVYLQKILYDYYIYQLRKAKQLLSEYQPFNSSFYRLSYLASDKQRKDEDEELERPTRLPLIPLLPESDRLSGRTAACFGSARLRHADGAGGISSCAAPFVIGEVFSSCELVLSDVFRDGWRVDWDSFSFVYLTPKPMAFIFLSADVVLYFC